MKNSIKLAILGLLGTLAFTNLSSVQANEISVNDNVKALLTEYYNKGVYKKATEIYLSPEAVDELKIYFHAGSTELERTTYYDGNQLWMSRKNGTYAYYGTDAEGNLTSATTQEALSVPEKASLAVTKGNNTDSQTWDTEDVGMEGYYITLKDISEDLFDDVTWTYENGVYAATEDKVLDYFRLFTAPCFLSESEENMNYITFTRVTVEELYGTLELKLYAEGTESGKLTSSGGIFSSATVVKDFQTSLGTELEPYVINTQADFDNFKAKAAAGSTFEGKYIELNTDVTLNDILNKTSATQFAGVFDGNNHVITLNIEGADHVAAFGYLAAAGEIKNVALEGTVNATAEKAGGLVATCYGIVRDCENRATITSTSDEVGGLVGYLCMGGKIYNSKNKNAVTSINGKSVGGIAGFAGGGARVEACENTGNVTGNSAVAGIVGWASQTNRVIDSTNTGTIQGVLSVGGIIGEAEKVKNITNNQNSGSISGNVPKFTSNSGVGGIIGLARDGESTTCTISENINNGKVENDGVCTGGIVGIVRGAWVLNNCTNNGEIIGAGSIAGGIIGVINFSNNTVDNCTNTADVTGATFVGGITGAFGISADIASTLSNCKNSGNVTATSKTPLVDTSLNPGARVGGIAGMARSVVKNCENRGTVKHPEGLATDDFQTGAPYAGLIVGYKTSKAVVENDK